MPTVDFTRKNSGFTLVELLVVISIISILAGALFMVINPAQLQKKSREAVLKAKTSQLCTALNNCGAVKTASTDCDSYAEMGVADPTGDPLNSSYSITTTDPITITGILDTCSFTCSFTFSDGSVGKLTGYGCL